MSEEFAVLDFRGNLQSYSLSTLLNSPGLELQPARSLQLSLGNGCATISVQFGKPDQLAVLNNDGIANLVNWKTSPEVGPSLVIDKAKIAVLDFSSDGELIAAGSAQGDVQLWKTATGSPDRSFHVGQPITAINFTTEGDKLLIATKTKQLIAWDLQTRAASYTAQLEDQGTQVIANGKLIAIGQRDGRLIVFDQRSGEQVLQWSAHAAPILRIWWEADGSLVTASFAGEVVRWRLTDLRRELDQLGLNWEE